MISNILLVEDNVASRDLIRVAIKEAGCDYRLHTVSTGQEAMDFLQHEPPYDSVPRPDVILLDLNLPGIGGIEVLRWIKENSRVRDIPVTILTGSESSRDIMECARYPGCHYAVKPTDFSGLVRFVKKLHA